MVNWVNTLAEYGQQCNSLNRLSKLPCDNKLQEPLIPALRTLSLEGKARNKKTGEALRRPLPFRQGNYGTIFIVPYGEKRKDGRASFHSNRPYDRIKKGIRQGFLLASCQRIHYNQALASDAAYFYPEKGKSLNIDLTLFLLQC